jgi:hypothetical protein
MKRRYNWRHQMINIVLAAFGVVLVIGGFYAMSYGFKTPPSISFFFIGLVLTVLGALPVIIFGSKVSMAEFKTPPEKVLRSKKSAESTKSVIKPKKMPEPLHKIKPKVSKKSEESPIKRLITDKKKNIKQAPEKPVVSKKIEPKRVLVDKKPDFSIQKAPKAPENKPEIIPPEIKPVSTKSLLDNKAKKLEVVHKEKKAAPVKTPPSVSKSVKDDKTKDHYVKDRLNRLKENYFKNTSDIENLIEERLDSFKGTLNKIKSESKDPGIIWSFDSKDVQGTMQDTVLKASKKVLMMYPWVRNIDISILKRFMETESKIILQEASLDDDASVELIKLLMENNVKIRTMPHVHTVAIVSDKDNGLIISTDPIYESFEVGVIYKDQRSIEEIERMFEEAWKLSQEIDLGLNN